MKLHLVSLGCSKNLVDSEMMLGRLKAAGWTILPEPDNAEAIVVNTCSFVEDAINESIDTILELAKFKHTGICKRLIVAGCLPERFREEIVQALPEVDVFLGTGAFDRVVQAVTDAPDQPRCVLPNPDLTSHPPKNVLRIQTFPHMAYLKVAEGCSRRCTYCIIPKLRGKQKSRPAEDITAEARLLIDSNVKELILVAQDTTSYGKDLSPPIDLGGLLEKISEMSDTIRVRFLYGHPESMDEKIISSVAVHPNICSYFDIPVQHFSDKILKRMGRNYSRNDVLRLFDKIRSLIPDASLRTTVMTGFPGETDADFELLLAGVETVRFDHLGVFVYSDFNDLPSHHLSGRVPDDVAKDRADLIMARQLEISRENNQRHIGKALQVLVEAATEDNVFTGRTFFQAPEVDGVTYVHAGKLKIGEFAGVRITEALAYDLIGEPV